MCEIRVHHNHILLRISAVYHLLGIWENDDEYVLRKVGKKLFHIIFLFSYVVALATGAYITNNRSESIFLTAMVFAIAVSFIRLVFIVRRKREISSFLKDIGEYFVTDEQEFIEKKKQLTSFTYISYLLFSILIIGFFIPPIVPIFSSDKRLPMNIGFPLNWRNSKLVYCIAFAYIQGATFIISLSMLNHLQVWYLMINYSIEYQMLANKFKNLGRRKAAPQTLKTSKISHMQKENLFLQEFIKLILIHRRIKMTVERFRDCFSYLFFAQIMTSAIDICGMIYVLAFNTHENLMEIVLFFFVLIYTFLDVFIVMYFGNEINFSSGQLSYSLFQSNWIDQSETCKKCLIILTEVLKEPQDLVIAKLYPLDLDTFTGILKLAYSMFNILQNLN